MLTEAHPFRSSCFLVNNIHKFRVFKFHVFKQTKNGKARGNNENCWNNIELHPELGFEIIIILNERIFNNSLITYFQQRSNTSRK